MGMGGWAGTCCAGASWERRADRFGCLRCGARCPALRCPAPAPALVRLGCAGLLSDALSINTIRVLAGDMVQKSNSGHPGE